MDAASVLLVDRHPDLLRTVTRFLEEQTELVVKTAMTCEEALDRAQLTQPHIIIVDLHMTDLTSVDGIKCLRERVPETAIVVLTLLDTQVYRQAALQAGADAFVSKATLETDLLPAVHEMLQKHGLRPSKSQPSSPAEVT